MSRCLVPEVFKTGDKCRAIYSGDGLLYAGVILDVSEADGVKTAVVEFTGYGTQESVPIESLMPPEDSAETIDATAEGSGAVADASPIQENGVDSKTTTIVGSPSSLSSEAQSEEEADIHSFVDQRSGRAWRSGEAFVVCRAQNVVVIVKARLAIPEPAYEGESL